MTGTGFEPGDGSPLERVILKQIAAHQIDDGVEWYSGGEGQPTTDHFPADIKLQQTAAKQAESDWSSLQQNGQLRNVFRPGLLLVAVQKAGS